MIKNPLKIKFKLTHPNAVLPKAIREGDIGFDIYAAEDTAIYPSSTKIVKTGLVLADCDMQAPNMNSWFMKVEGRSGMAVKGVFPVGGIIDPTYRGEIGVILFNSSNEEKYLIKQGDRVAQLVLYNVVSGNSVVFSEATEINETNRGASGYGSSGK